MVVLLHKGFLSAVKRTKLLITCECLLKMKLATQVTTLYEELELLFDKFPLYFMKDV